ncbi:MAG: hypothetical protein PHR45_08170 [Muribaculaceae bacterium]|nr:hypothetical protein [Muribaculaceae bacterium]
MKKSIPIILMLGGTLLLFSSTSCDDSYDLSKDINSDITIGGNFSVPVGKTDKIMLNRIIKESEDLTVNNNGIYELNADGQFNTSVAQINPVIVTGLNPIIGDVNIAIPDGNQLINTDITIDNIEIKPDPGHYTVNTKLPKEVQKINSIDFNNKNLTTNLSLTVNVPTGVKQIKLTNIQIKIPDILEVLDNSGAVIKPSNGYNIYKANDITFSPSITTNQIIIKIPRAIIPEGSNYIKGTPGNLSIVLDKEFSISALASITVNPSQITATNASLKFNYSVPTTNITKVNGDMKPDASISETLLLNDIPDFVKGENSSFELSNLGFNFSINNTIDLDLATSLTITPWSNSNNRADGEAVVINLTGNNSIKGNSKNNFLISNKAKNVTTGITNIIEPKLSTLLKKIPEAFKIEANNFTATSNTESQGIELGRNYDLVGNYDIDAPFEFSNIELEYKDSIEDLLNDLKDVANKTNRIIVTAEAINAIPTDLKFDVKLYDINGNELKEINVGLDKCVLASAKNSDAVESSETTSQIQITLTEPQNSSQLEALDKIIYYVTAKNSITGEIALKSKQYILIKNILVKIPDGVTVTF